MKSRTSWPEIFGDLSRPFEPGEVKQRSQAGRQLHYITARTAMNRLDEVMGPENWWDQYIPGAESVMCGITIRLPDGATLTKWDAGGYAGMADSGDDDKSGFSDAFKRAAVKFGVARYLYRDGVADFDAPAASPEPPAAQRPRVEPDPGRMTPMKGGTPVDGLPRSGPQLYAWLKDQGERRGMQLDRLAMDWARDHAGGKRIKDLSGEEVAAVVEAASGYIAANSGDSIPPIGGDTPEPAAVPDSIRVAVGGERDIPRPTTGSQLYLAANAVQQEHGVGAVRPLQDDAASRGVRSKMAEWSPDDVGRGWALLCRIHADHQAPRAADPGPAREVGRKARELIGLVHQVDPARIDKATVGAKVREVYGSLWPGEVIGSLSACDPDRLAEMSRCLDELIAEVADVPAGI